MCTTRSVGFHLLRSDEVSPVVHIGPFTYEASLQRAYDCVCVRPPVTQMFALAIIYHRSSVSLSSLRPARSFFCRWNVCAVCRSRM